MHSKQKIADNFSRAANNYDKIATLQRNVGHKLINYIDEFLSENLIPAQTGTQKEYLQRKALRGNNKSFWLDIGGGTGYFANFLAKRHPGSRIINIDIAQKMLSRLHKDCICADFDFLPIADRSVDFIFANLSLQWSLDLNKTLVELKRVLELKGLLVFSTLGSQTLYELRHSWKKLDDRIHVNSFFSLDELKNILQSNQFKVNCYKEKIIQNYSTIYQLMRNLKTIGANHVHSENKPKGLMTKQILKRLESVYKKYSTATYEIIYVIATLEKYHD